MCQKRICKDIKQQFNFSPNIAKKQLMSEMSNNYEIGSNNCSILIYFD